MNVTCLIIGIGGWEEYTAPLVASLQEHEPTAGIVVIDNESANAYPILPYVVRTPRLSYAAAINRAASLANPSDWYIVLSNDVLCTGPFVADLADRRDCIVGPQIRQTHGFRYLEGWCVAAPANVWDVLAGWDANYQVSSWEDVDFSVRAAGAGFAVTHVPTFPFRHLDQRQRFTLVPDYWDSEAHNVAYFMRKHVGVTL